MKGTGKKAERRYGSLTWLAATSFIFSFLLITEASAATFYVRSDGGTRAQCTGKADAAYPGSGQQQACAFRHPFEALPPNANTSNPTAPAIAGGDTLIVKRGSYEMGSGAPGASAWPACNPNWTWDCAMPSIPSGPSSSQPTRILGEGWDRGCPAAPELWGSGRPRHILSLDKSSNVVVGCLEITDHSSCIEGHPGGSGSSACNRNTPPFGPWAPLGIYAVDSSNVRLHDVKIHGLANAGIKAGRLRDWTLERVKLLANGWAGWDGDLGSGSSSNSGQILFREVEVGWSGCNEQYPGGQITGCWGQQGGGYGDGLGTARTGGNWVIVDSHFHHNTQDGLDLLYADGTGSITVERSRFEGNAGNQAKLAGNSRVVNSIINGNCSYFNGKYNMTSGDHCRAMGNALSLNLTPGTSSTVSYTSIASEGDCAVLATGGDASSRIRVQNSLVVGYTAWVRGDTPSCLAYWEGGTSGAAVSFANTLVRNVRGDACPAGTLCGRDPKIADARLATFNPMPLVDSPLRGAANGALDATRVDYLGKPRPTFGGYDIGAYQYQGAGGGGTGDSVFAHGFER